MEDVNIVKRGAQILMVDILGTEKLIAARIKELQLVDHRIILEEVD